MSSNDKFGRYEIISELGRGAMGVVYKATDPMLNRVVAIKTIDMSVDKDEREEYEGRFYQEAKAVGGLTHPNIVTVYDIGHEGNSVYMAMEFLEGVELRKLYGEGRPLPIKQAVEIVAQVAEGLGYAHEAGIVHRDVKPANIMMLKNGTAKITDFGIARMRSAEVKTQTGMLLGSPRYIAPEVFLGSRADGRADIFSLGVILYEMLTGVAPFTGDSVNALMYQTVNHVQAPPSTLMSGIPPMLDFIVAKSLAKKPEERYQDARDEAHDLRACLEELRTSAAAPTTTGTAVDDMSKTLLTISGQMARIEDIGESEDPAPTRGVAREFDSFEATQRLVAGDIAAQNKNDEDALTATAIVPRSTAAGWLASLKKSPLISGWTKPEAIVFAGGTGLATVIALVIAFT